MSISTTKEIAEEHFCVCEKASFSKGKKLNSTGKLQKRSKISLSELEVVRLKQYILIGGKS